MSFSVFATLIGTFAASAFQLIAIKKLNLDQYSQFSLLNAVAGVIGITTAGIPWIMSASATLQNQDITRKTTNTNLSKLFPKGIELNIFKASLYWSFVLVMLIGFCANLISDQAVELFPLTIFLPLAVLQAISFGRWQILANTLKLNVFSALAMIVRLLSLIAILKFTHSPVSIFYLLCAGMLFFYICSSLSFSKNYDSYHFLGTPRWKTSFSITLAFWLICTLDLLLIRQKTDSINAGSYSLIANLCRLTLAPALFLVQKFFGANRRSHAPSSKHLLMPALMQIIAAVIIFRFGPTFFRLLSHPELVKDVNFVSIYVLSLIPLSYAIPKLQNLIEAPHFIDFVALFGTLILGLVVNIYLARGNWQICANQFTMYCVILLYFNFRKVWVANV